MDAGAERAAVGGLSALLQRGHRTSRGLPGSQRVFLRVLGAAALPRQHAVVSSGAVALRETGPTRGAGAACPEGGAGPAASAGCLRTAGPRAFARAPTRREGLVVPVGLLVATGDGKFARIRKNRAAGVLVPVSGRSLAAGSASPGLVRGSLLEFKLLSLNGTCPSNVPLPENVHRASLYLPRRRLSCGGGTEGHCDRHKRIHAASGSLKNGLLSAPLLPPAPPVKTSCALCLLHSGFHGAVAAGGFSGRFTKREERSAGSAARLGQECRAGGAESGL